MSEPTTSPALPLTTLRPIILTTGPFLFAWSLLRQYTSKSGPLPFSASISIFHNQAYALFSLLSSYLLVQSFFLSPNTSSNEPLQIPLPFNLTIPFLALSSLTVDELRYIYHLSKFYEYVDVLLLVAQGKVIHQHMAFHHVSMPFLTYFRVLNCTGGDWRVFALANSVHHTLMYAYFGGVAWLRRVVMVTGWVQLALGVGVDALWMYKTKGGKELEIVGGEKGEDEATNRGIAILFLARYGMLYWEELKEKREGVRKVEEGKEVQKEPGDGRGQVQRRKGKADEKSKKRR